MTRSPFTAPPRGRRRPFPSALRIVLGFGLAAVAGIAQPAAPGAATAASGPGVITGRVLNAADGKYLDKAVVQIVGTDFQALTDQSGQYYLADVPAGAAVMRVSFNGLEPITEIVTVTPGQTVTHDFTFNRGRVAANGALMLDAFVVQESKETNAEEIAINEQRESPNVKTVIAADSFGHIMNGNVADFVKYLPGVTVDYGSEISTYGNDADAQRISLRGVPSNEVPITVAGMPVADASANLSRTYEMDQLSINNASRVEVIEQPTPDLPFDTPAGIINIVPKTAFEYARPTFNFDVYINFNNEDFHPFEKEPGPHNSKTYHTLPGFDFTYVVPVSKTFGFTVTALSSNQYNPGAGTRSDWTYTGAGSFADPYLDRVRFVNTPRDAFRQSAGFTVDWKPSPANTVSIGYMGSTSTGYNINRTEDFNKLVPTGNLATNYGPTFNYTSSTSVSNEGDFQETTGFGQNWTGRWDLYSGPWQLNFAGSFSQSSSHLNSGKDGYVSDYSDGLTGVKAVNLSGIENGVPTSIVALNSAGVPIDYTQAANYNLPSSINIGSSASRDVEEAMKFDLRRDFDFLPFRWMTLAAKTGFYFQREERSQYGAGESPEYDLNTAYETSPITADTFLDTVNVGYQGHYPVAGAQQWLDPYKLYQYWLANPDVYSLNQPNTYHTYVNNNKDVVENKGQYYFMFDSSFLHNRLRVVVGLRGEKDIGDGRIPYTEPEAIYEHNPDGSLVTVNGARVLIPGLTTMQEYQLIYQPLVYQATHSTQKPSDIVNLAYDITANLKALVNFSKTYGPQNYSSLTTGGGGGIPEITQLTPPATNADGSIGTISIANPNLPPEIANTWDFKLAYYTSSGGVLSADYYYKTTSNYTYTTTTLITPENAASLSAPGLSFEPSDYINYDLSENAIDPTTLVHDEGWEYEVQQNFAFVPYVGKYFTLFANYTMKKVSGVPLNADASSPNDIASTDAGGLTFSDRLFTIRLLTTDTALETLEHTSVKVNGVTYLLYEAIPSVRRWDGDFEFRFSRHIYLFANALNLFNARQKTIWFGPGIPTYSYPENNFDYGVQVNAGISGSF